MKEPYRCFLSCSGAKVPEPPEGHKWQKVIHENKVHVSTNTVWQRLSRQGKYVRNSMSSFTCRFAFWEQQNTVIVCQMSVFKVLSK